MKLIGSPPRESAQWDVRPEQVSFALQERLRFASRPEPVTAECAHCADRQAELVPEPHGARYATGARVLVCKDLCTPADPERHDLDPEDPVFASVASRWPSATEADYPGWPDHMAALIAKNQQPGRAS